MKQFDEFVEKSKEHISENRAKEHNALVFAYVGDAVFSLYIRNYFATLSTFKAGVLNTKVNKIVRASAQSKILDYIEQDFTEQELQITKSARNIRTNNVAKNSSLEEYKRATSFEAIIGYLYMTNQIDRLNYFLEKSLNYVKESENIWK